MKRLTGWVTIFGILAFLSFALGIVSQSNLLESRQKAEEAAAVRPVVYDATGAMLAATHLEKAEVGAARWLGPDPDCPACKRAGWSLPIRRGPCSTPRCRPTIED
jgi:hypothetical protein